MPMSAQPLPPQHQNDADRHRAAPAEAASESTRQVDPVATAGAREVRSAPPAHPTARSRRQQAVLRLQRTYGNRHVTGLLQRQEEESEAAEEPSEEVAAEPSSEQIYEATGASEGGGEGEPPAESGGGEAESAGEEASPYVEAAPEEPVETAGTEEAPAEAIGEEAGQELAAPLGNEEVEAEGESQEAPSRGGLIVGDDVTDLGPGQMRKGEFLGGVRNVATAAVESVLGDSPLLPLARQEIDQQLRTYQGMTPSALEQTVQQEVPGSAGATAASDYLPQIGSRVRAVAEEASGGGVVGAAVDAATSAANGLISGIGDLLFKAREGGARDGADPRAIRARLGPGEPLSGSTGSGLAAAFGQDFSAVRVHTDGRAAEVSASLNARAFTIGRDVAFGAGEYQPGTPAGDALIAHELAHVAQQSAMPATQAPLAKGEGEVDALEEDADRSAVGAVMSLWGGMKSGLADVAHQALPRLRTGLRLQRCNGGAKSPASAVPPVPGDVIPYDHAPKSRAGEEIIFNDEFTHATPNDFQLVYTATGGKFDSATGSASKTIAGLTSGNVYFFIDAAWNGTDAVTVHLDVKRLCDGAIVLNYDWTFGKKGTTPTTITQQETEGERPLGSKYTYKLGPDLGGDAKDDYIGQTIIEKFGQRTCNIALADLKPDWLKAHPAIKTDADVTAHFFGTSSSNGTFTVSAGDKIYDGHSGMAVDKATMEAALITMKEVYVDLPQWYEVEPGVVLGKYTIRRILKTDGSKVLKKMRVP
jgi:hypothetical protein